MIPPVQGRRGTRLRPAAILALVFAIAPARANAEPCSFIDPETLTCSVAPAQVLHQGRIDRTLATDPTFARSKSRLSAKTRQKPSGETSVAPFALTPDGDNKTNFAVSLTQFGSAFSFADWRRIEDAKTNFGGDRPLPKPVAATIPAFDIWAEGRSEKVYGDQRSRNFTTYLGADYRLTSRFLFGAMVQIDETRRSVVSVQEDGRGGGYLAGPYVAYRLSPNLTIGSNFGWGVANDSASLGASYARFETNRALTQTHLTGQWGWGKWQLMQSASVTYVDESTAGSRLDLAGADVEMTRLTVGPELKRRFDTGPGSSLEPFAFYKSSLDLETHWADPAVRQSVGGGLVIHRPAGYRIEARGDYSEALEEKSLDESMSGKVMVFVPLP